MGRKIEVTFIMDTDDMEPEHVDLNHEMGLSEDGYLWLGKMIPGEDINPVLQPE